MRKNLFLTVALVLASFAGAVAQNWSVTLGAAEGLPGETASKDGGNVKYYRSGVIKADKPIKTLRFTCAANSTSHKPNGNNARMMLSELNVYTADMSRELTYTVKSNADHNTLAKAFDGQGLRALYDGKYNNWFSSMSAANGAVAEYHYLELTFEENIERFVIEWGGKQGSGEAPSVVVLTEGGVSAEPYADRNSSFSTEKITTVANLEAADYFTICGNAPTSYHTYNNETGEQTSKEPLEGSGPMYVVLGDTYAKEPTLDYLTKLIPVGDGTYYIYFAMYNKYLSADASQNALNEALNGWQYGTSDITKAAKVTLTPRSKEAGDFEMSYTTVNRMVTNEEEETVEENIKVYVGADPRTGKMKIFREDRKKALEQNKWCLGFGLVCTFNWSFYGAEYTAPSWAKQYEIGKMYLAAKDLADAIADDEAAIEGGYIEMLDETVAGLEDALNSDMDEDEINATVADAKIALSNFINDLANEEWVYMGDQWDEWVDNSSSNVAMGNYNREAYDTYIQPGKDLIIEVSDTDYDGCYEYLSSITNYFAKKADNVSAFLASVYEASTLPIEFGTDAEALGTKANNAWTWEQSIGLSKAVNGFRITFLETNIGNAGGGGKWNGYPMVALGDLQVYDNDGNQITIASASTNSQETSEGPIENLTDGDNGNFWHSIWGNGSMDPAGYVYLDIQFPEGETYDAFKIKSIGRNNGSLSPKKVVISEYKTLYSEGVAVENAYNVVIGKQITNVADLKDGGLYVMQGNLYVKRAENAAAPRYYAGTTPYSDDKKVAADAPCVYMFKKAADGTWNILSLNKGMFWVKEPEHGTSNLVLYQTEAGGVKFAASNNIANAFVIYRDITPEVLKGSFSNEEAGVNIPETEITVSKLVYMDWDSGLASRPCYSELPGVVAPGCEALTDDLKVTAAAGDYLHFNKTNGEGEWNIFEATMDDAYFVYLSGLVKEVNNLDLTPGTNPGCIMAAEEDAAAFENAKAAAVVAVNEEIKENAAAVAEELIDAIYALKDSKRVGFDADAVYQIQSGLNKYEENTWATRSVYADNEEGRFEWTVTPNSFENENYNFLFKVITVDEEINTIYRLGVQEANLGKVYIIKVFDQDTFAGAHDDASNNILTAAQPVAYKINDLGACDFEIITLEGNRYWHTEGHAEGNGYGGRLVNWNCGNNLNTASSWTFINMGEMEETAIEELVIEGDEVVSVSYFTPAGTAIPAPVKGINIVVTVYANGVVEAKKKIVK